MCFTYIQKYINPSCRVPSVLLVCTWFQDWPLCTRWTTCGSILRENDFLCLMSLVAHNSLSRVEILPRESDPSFHVSMSISNVIFQSLFMLLYCWSIVDIFSLSFLVETIPWQSFWLSGSYTLSAPSGCSLSLRGKKRVIEIVTGLRSPK